MVDQLDIETRERQFLEYHLLKVALGPLRFEDSGSGVAAHPLHHVR